MGESLETIAGFIENIKTGAWYISHPKELGIIAWRFVDEKSFWVCMFICLGATLLYLCGIDKYKKWGQGSLLIYIVIKMLSAGGLLK
jgi:hypothetical protein